MFMTGPVQDQGVIETLQPWYIIFRLKKHGGKLCDMCVKAGWVQGSAACSMPSERAQQIE